MKRYLSVLGIFILVLMLAACGMSFDGSRTGNDSQLIMKYKIFNARVSQELVLEEGDVIDAEIVKDAGSLAVTIQKEDDEPIYDNESVAAGTFEIEIKESGTYKITVIGKKAKGSLSFIKRI